MKTADAFVAKTLRAFLIIFGFATCVPLLLAYNVDAANTIAFHGLLEYGPSSVPALRHWGIMVFGIGVLMIAAAFRPWLRFETMAFSTIEKSFMVYLYLASAGQPWISAYTAAFAIDSAIVLYSAVYFVSSYGRSRKWALVNERESAAMVRTIKAS